MAHSPPGGPWLFPTPPERHRSSGRTQNPWFFCPSPRACALTTTDTFWSPLPPGQAPGSLSTEHTACARPGCARSLQPGSQTTPSPDSSGPTAAHAELFSRHPSEFGPARAGPDGRGDSHGRRGAGGVPPTPGGSPIPKPGQPHGRLAGLPEPCSRHPSASALAGPGWI